jgi:hypothetical protein
MAGAEQISRKEPQLVDQKVEEQHEWGWGDGWCRLWAAASMNFIEC